jgi:transposase InsO family protein
LIYRGVCAPGCTKTELVCNRGPWRRIDDLQLATLEWVDCFNHHRLLEPAGDVPPAEYETANDQPGQLSLPGTQWPASTNPGGSSKAREA